MESRISPLANGRGTGSGGLRNKVLESSRLCLVRELLSTQVGQAAAERIVLGKRKSSLNQYEIAWRSLQSWLKESGEEDINIKSMLKFFMYLRDEKGLNPSTIMNYRGYLTLPLKLLANLDLQDWKFKELDRAFFIENPPNRPSLPLWSVEKVLDLLKSPDYHNSSASVLNLLKKTLFLVALASGNRCSEIAAMWLPFHRESDNSLKIPVKPGFLFKNQRSGRSPPDILILPLLGNDKSLCPVSALQDYWVRRGRPRGPLFVNSRNDNPLRAPSIAHLLCSIIEESNPGSVPRAHDLRKAATSIAWSRGLRMENITQRAFWKTSNVFIERYLCPMRASGVALGTRPE